MEPAPELPRISVDTPEDWKRVQSSFDNALESAMQRVLGQATDQAALKQHLKRWRDATFEAAKPNLRVNGHNFEDYEQLSSTEPFDEALDRSIWALNAERIAWDKTLSDRRHTAPAEIDTIVQDMLHKQSGDDEPETPPLDDMILDEDDPMSDERRRETADIHETLHDSAQELSKEIPELLKRQELATQAARNILASQT